ncbi:hypothetical protein [Sphingorhabdus sp. YGSMI21]|uniref:hypothetical protein n=1 Tax=Sphingorhabdus sp. YGSMI21 TaxID=2077182 RepID=UPI003204962F
MTAARPSLIGPILILDNIENGRLTLSALFIVEGKERPPDVKTSEAMHAPEILAQFDSATVWRVRFNLPSDRPSEYRWNGEIYPVAGDLRGDLRIAFVSCNGEEIGDLEREGSERNAMWRGCVRRTRRNLSHCCCMGAIRSMPMKSRRAIL